MLRNKNEFSICWCARKTKTLNFFRKLCYSHRKSAVSLIQQVNIMILTREKPMPAKHVTERMNPTVLARTYINITCTKFSLMTLLEHFENSCPSFKNLLKYHFDSWALKCFYFRSVFNLLFPSVSINFTLCKTTNASPLTKIPVHSSHGTKPLLSVIRSSCCALVVVLFAEEKVIGKRIECS